MIFRKTFLIWIYGISLFATPLSEQLKETGYLEICDENYDGAAFDLLYLHFDTLIEFFQTNPIWAHKLYSAKERFIRSKEKNYYSTDFFGFYNESKKIERSQISFYYSTHFHEFISYYYPELIQEPKINNFLDACLETQRPYGKLFNKAAIELDVEMIFSSEYENPPVLFKVIKYLPSYVTGRPHYDGSAFSLFINSTDQEALLLAPYQASFTTHDFSSPLRECDQASILLIPGVLLTEFSIDPTPHVVMASGKVRYATVAFAMRPHYTPLKFDFPPLPSF